MAHCRCRSPHVLACIILASAPAAVRAQNIVGLWTVEYQTRALTVEAVEESLPEGNFRLVTVKLRNTSGRPISAVAIDIEAGIRGRLDMAWSGTPLKSGQATDIKIKQSVTSDAYRRVRLNAVLFADKGPDDGDPSAVHMLRFARLGGLLEENRCLEMLNRLDPSRLDDSTVTELLASVDESPTTLDEALASLPQDPQLRVGSRDRIRGASADAKSVFLTEVRVRRRRCNDEARRLTQRSASPAAERALRVQHLRLESQRRIDAVRPYCEHDMGVEQ